ncbi:MAG: KpsF/GutQ family sugar-phosphate isomerase [Candidatus Omnitrophota bacterium]|jgi:arabinose-5-phosphate isomerase
MKKEKILVTARRVLAIEARAIQRLSGRLGKDFEAAVKLLAACRGRVIVTGMGKPGFIARKIAATLASTGTPSLFIHPAEAFHGDLGMVTEQDVVIAISHSGETKEIVELVPEIKRFGVPLIALTSHTKSDLARHADIVLDLAVSREACPLNLAPSASTTASLAMGDALALCLVKKKGFRSEDFALLHPGGSLGKNFVKVREIMRTGRRHPVAHLATPVHKVLLAITAARAGSCSIVDRQKKLVGIFTDGDLRRHLRESGEGILAQPVERFATRRPLKIAQDKLAVEAVHLLKSKNIDELPVVDVRGRAVGLLDVQDLLKAGFI